MTIYWMAISYWYILLIYRKNARMCNVPNRRLPKSKVPHPARRAKVKECWIMFMQLLYEELVSFMIWTNNWRSSDSKVTWNTISLSDQGRHFSCQLFKFLFWVWFVLTILHQQSFYVFSSQPCTFSIRNKIEDKAIWAWENENGQDK